MRLLTHTLFSTVLIVATSTPVRADAQVWKQIRDSVTKKAAAHKKAVDSTLVHTAVRGADSALVKTERGANAVLTASSSLVDTALNKTEHGVSGLFRGRDSTSEKLEADVARG